MRSSARCAVPRDGRWRVQLRDTRWVEEQGELRGLCVSRPLHGGRSGMVPGLGLKAPYFEELCGLG
jgi:hypothetical protein